MEIKKLNPGDILVSDRFNEEQVVVYVGNSKALVRNTVTGLEWLFDPATNKEWWIKGAYSQSHAGKYRRHEYKITKDFNVYLSEKGHLTFALKGSEHEKQLEEITLKGGMQRISLV